jgi:cell division inhibitor SepF
MAGFLKKAQVYLGLGPDDEYEDYDEPDPRGTTPARDLRDARDPVRGPSAESGASRSSVRAASPTSAASRTTSSRPAPPRAPRESVRTRPAPPDPPAGDTGEGSVVRTLPPKERNVESAPLPSKPKTAVRPVVASAKPVVVSPSSFNSAQEVADKFKASQPVIVNLQGVDRELSRRLLDFCSGVCYSLSGHMERVAARVYLLTPADVEVSAEDRRRLTERGLAG